MNWTNPFLDEFGDKLREECGVFGAINASDASAATALGLHALQHRGQEAAGITSYDGKEFFSRRGLGHVAENFSSPEAIAELPGYMAAGHVRYSTTGGAGLRNVQPLYADLASGGFAVAHNGNISNSQKLRAELVQNGAIFQSTSDTEVIIHLVATSRYPTMVDRLVDALRLVEGAYALVVMTPEGMIACRDPLGIRPLVMGKMGDAVVFASETVAFDVVGAEFVREVEPGELIRVDFEGKIETLRPFGNHSSRPCIFEHVYLARPYSVMDDVYVYKARLRMGVKLAEKILRTWPEHDIDVVIPIPDTGRTAALPLAYRLGVKFREGFVKNRYIGRTFIMPGQQQRKKSVRQKLNAIDLEFQGKNVLLVDDSIVRGTTSQEIVQMARESGAAKVYFASASPPVRYPNVYGIDMPSASELVAYGRTETELEQLLGADRLIYQDLEDLIDAVQHKDSKIQRFDTSVFTGEYITQDVTHEYLNQLELFRSDAARQVRDRQPQTVIDIHNA